MMSNHENVDIVVDEDNSKKKLQVESAAHVIKCVFEIPHFKQRIPGLIGATCC